MTAYDVTVIGSGFAGLSAAVGLAGEGARVLVLEARNRLGGRATAFVDRDTGELVDNGQHILLGCYRATLEFLRTIGADRHLAAARALRVTMIDREGRRSCLECPDLPAPLCLLAGIFDWEALRWSDRLSALRMAGPLRTARRALEPGATAIAASPGETVENWLIRNGQTARIREMLWEPLALAALNQPIAYAAAPPFARVLAEMFGSDPQAATILLPTVPLHQLYAEPAREYLERHGGTVRTGAAGMVEVREGRIGSVASGADRWTSRAVVCAVPWFALRDVFSGDLAPLGSILDRAKTMGSSPIVSVNLWFDRPVLDEPFVGLPGRTMQWVFDKRSLVGGAASHVALVASGAAQLIDRSNADLIAGARGELNGALPEARGAALLRATVVREPRATFSLEPGQPPRPGTNTAVPGLFLAGDWIDTGLPATIESAVRSGYRAAAAVCAMIAGRPPERWLSLS